MKNNFQRSDIWQLCGVVFVLVLCCVFHPSSANHVHNHHSQHGSHAAKWFRTETLDGNGLFVVDWRINGKDIVFRVTVNTRGYIGLGFSYKNEKVGEADLILAWVDDRTGEPNALVNHILFYSRKKPSKPVNYT